ATFAPSRAARSPIARPMPRLAPVMNSVFPRSDLGRYDYARSETVGVHCVLQEIRIGRSNLLGEELRPGDPGHRADPERPEAPCDPDGAYTAGLRGYEDTPAGGPD